MKTCNRDKLHHKTERDALDHLAWARKQSQGKGVRNLNAYQCSCGGWYVGRAWRGKRERESQSCPEQITTEPQPKPLTPGQARRKEKRERKKAERHQRRAQADYRENIAYANWLLDRELALAAATKTKD